MRLRECCVIGSCGRTQSLRNAAIERSPLVALLPDGRENTDDELRARSPPIQSLEDAREQLTPGTDEQ
jgi:hypothetical protein